VKNGLGEYLSKMGMTQLRIAETEKYAHVTFFFNGVWTAEVFWIPPLFSGASTP